MKKTILLLCLLTSATAFAQFSGKGTGDKASPYQVTTAAQLDELRNCLKEETYVKLMNDIDLTDYIAKKYPKEGWALVTEGEHESPTFTFDFHFVEHLPLAPASTTVHQWEQVFTRPDITVWRKGMLERRLLSSMECPYAIYEEDSDRHADIWFPLALSSNLSIDGVLISTLSLERHLAPLGTYIFHCAYMSHDGMAVLLSGPSGAGKSTHAHLWEQFVANTYIVNGDRCRHLSERVPSSSRHCIHRANTRQPIDTGVSCPIVHPALLPTDRQPLEHGSHGSSSGLGVIPPQHLAGHGVRLQHGARRPLQLV